MGFFENKRTFTSIIKLLFIIQQLVEKEVVSGIFNVAVDQSLLTNVLIRLIADLQLSKAKIWNISTSVIAFLAQIGDH